jgi:hypothetical protein
VFANAQFIDENDKVIRPVYITPEYSSNKKLTVRDVIISTLNHGNTLVCSSPMFRKNIFVYILSPFRYHPFKYSSDLDMWLRAAEYSRIVVIEEPFISYRISNHQGSAGIHKLRTAEEGIFYLMDSYLTRYTDIPQDALDKYELRRLNDKYICTINLIKKIGLRLPRMIVWGLLQKMGVK